MAVKLITITNRNNKTFEVSDRKPLLQELRTQGGAMIMIDCDVENGGMKINKDFIVDFGKEPNGPSRCHESRYPGGDCTSDIWL